MVRILERQRYIYMYLLFLLFTRRNGYILIHVVRNLKKTKQQQQH